jgi:guanine deaminase
MTTTPEFRLIVKGLMMNPIAAGRVDVYDPGYLVISGETVERLDRRDPSVEFPGAAFVDAGQKTILPGFVDTHVHLPQFAIIGTGSGELLTWLQTYTYPEEARFVDPEYADKIARQFFDALVANGTTSAMIYSSVHEQATDIAFSVARAKGIRAFIGKVMMDRNSPAGLQEETAESILASIRLFEKWDSADNGRLRYVFTPRFAAACSMDLMKAVGEIARERGAFVQSHLSENKDEVEWVRQLFPGSASYTDVYDRAGMLTPRSIMAHCIHLSQGEIALLAKRQAKVAFCPYSNLTLRSGTMPYKMLRDAGLNVSLGTDIAGGPSLSMLEQMDQAVRAANISQDEALYLATLGGATALGLEDRIGSFQPGKDADFVVVDEKRVQEVYVRGKLVYFRANE